MLLGKRDDDVYAGPPAGRSTMCTETGRRGGLLLIPPFYLALGVGADDALELWKLVEVGSILGWRGSRQGDTGARARADRTGSTCGESMTMGWKGG